MDWEVSRLRSEARRYKQLTQSITDREAIEVIYGMVTDLEQAAATREEQLKSELVGDPL
jgi:hypothetical protein